MEENKQIVYILLEGYKLDKETLRINTKTWQGNENLYSPISWRMMLPEGESILERQIRLLSAQGISDFVLGMEEYEQDASKELTDNLLGALPKGTNLRSIASEEMIQDIQKTLMDRETFSSAILLPGSIVYDQRFAKKLVRTEGACAFLSKSAVNRKNAGKFHRIDFKYAQETGLLKMGASWFASLSIYKLDAARAEILTPSDNPITSIEQSIGKLELAPVFDGGGYVLLPKDKMQLITTHSKILAFDYASRRIVKGSACIVNLPDWLATLKANKPLLVYDQTGLDVPIEDVLSSYSIPYSKVFCENEPDVTDSVSEMLAVCKTDQCDCVISVGGESAVRAAKLLRVCVKYGVELSDKMNLSHAVCYFPHISIPLNRKAATMTGSSYEYVSAYGGSIVRKYHMTPDLLVWDSLIMQKYRRMDPENEPEDQTVLLNRGEDDPENKPEGQTAFQKGEITEDEAENQTVLLKSEKEKPEDKSEDQAILQDNGGAESANQTEESDALLKSREEQPKNVIKRTTRKKRPVSLKSKLRKLLVKLMTPGMKQLCRIVILKWTYWTKRMNNQAVVFESYHGKQATCNPYAMYKAMRSCPDYKGFVYIWAVNNPKRFKWLSAQPDTRVVKRNSLRHVRALATSRFIVSNMSVPSFFRPGKEQIYINTWHGKLIKNIGMDVANSLVGGRGDKRQKKNFVKNSKRFTYILSPSSAFNPWLISAFDLKRLHRENIIRETGYPRNDFLFSFTEKDVLRVKLRLGIPLNKKVVLYAPTWRAVDYQGKGYVYQNPIDFTKLKEELGDEYVILFRAHNLEAASINFTELGDSVIDATKVKEVNDLLIVSDLLISDYSGIIYDYANLRRPIILYHYDRDDYINNQTGVYIDLDVLPGYVVTDGNDLGKTIVEAIRNFVYDEKYQKFNEVYNGLDGADCGLRTVRELIPEDLSPTPRQLRMAEVRRKFKQAKCHIGAFLRTTGLKREANDKRILSYKNKHKGKRVFLVGNGPSLRLEDLEAIRYEYSFACNKIYKSFDRMKWRPTYYFFSDKVFVSEFGKMRKAFKGKIFSNDNFLKPRYRKLHIICAHTMSNPEYYVHGNMLEYYVPSAATVMTFMIEMAMYMGFSEIYLIGVDCTNGFVNTSNHFMDGYMTSAMESEEQRRARNLATGDKKLTLEELGQYRVDRSMAAYDKLREYADKHGIKVYNATRGGMLEAFERVDFDEMSLKEQPRTSRKKRR